MEKNYELIVRPKDKKIKFKNILKKIHLKKLFFILIFFFACYVISELLNGNSIEFKRVFDFSIKWEDKADYIESLVQGFFKCPKFIINYCLFVCLYFILYGLTNGTKTSCLVILICDFLFGIINYTVRSFRGVSITLSDIYSIRTALNVADGLKLSINGNFVTAVCLFILFFRGYRCSCSLQYCRTAGRWVMNITVRLLLSRMLRSSRHSVSPSSADVASSNTIICLSRSNALAMAMR